MILEMDFGNTRIKWRLRHDREVVLRDAMDFEKGLGQISDKLHSYIDDIHAIWIASVLDESAKVSIRFWAEKDLKRQPVFVQAQHQMAGVINGYNDPLKLGVDRWLAMISAYNYCHSACVVISCGTAMTVDLIETSGRHLGGYIVPGWRAALSSLNQNTQLIRLPDIGEASLQPGRYTQAAVDHGLTACYVGLIQNAIIQLNTRSKQDGVTMLATGGDAYRLLAYFPDVILREELILDGLAYCLI